jgi:hypothetical protein
MSEDIGSGDVPDLGAFEHRQIPVALLFLIPAARITSFYGKSSNLAQLWLLDDL